MGSRGRPAAWGQAGACSFVLPRPRGRERHGPEPSSEAGEQGTGLGEEALLGDEMEAGGRLSQGVRRRWDVWTGGDVLT